MRQRGDRGEGGGGDPPLCLSSSVTYCSGALEREEESGVVRAGGAASWCMPRRGRCPRMRAEVHWTAGRRKGSSGRAPGPRTSIPAARWMDVLLAAPPSLSPPAR